MTAARTRWRLTLPAMLACVFGWLSCAGCQHAAGPDDLASVTFIANGGLAGTIRRNVLLTTAGRLPAAVANAGRPAPKVVVVPADRWWLVGRALADSGFWGWRDQVESESPDAWADELRAEGGGSRHIVWDRPESQDGRLARLFRELEALARGAGG